MPSQYKYDFLDGYPRGSAGINMFSISNMSEFVPRGGVDIFQKCLKFKNVWIIRGGGGSSLIGNLSQIFPFFFSDASPKAKKHQLQQQQKQEQQQLITDFENGVIVKIHKS